MVVVAMMCIHQQHHRVLVWPFKQQWWTPHQQHPFFLHWPWLVFWLQVLFWFWHWPWNLHC
jgi:hypothetical protein